MGRVAVTEWLVSTVPIFKALHLLALGIWCGGLIALPLMLARHDFIVSRDEYRIIRHRTHQAYTTIVTPAAVIAVIAGTWLVFLRQAFVPWLFAKLVFVAVLLVVHVWIGHNIVRIAEEPGDHKPPNPYLPVTGVLACSTAILLMVLGKPDLDWILMPEWLRVPRGGHLPFDVPSR
ncbi:CopD family protein [Hoeflea ulvae]|uniref:CopD family protein n=1 Tax=Hoeflea ulvae TaxID=2983764 RepID=A0ABT3YMG6_9HYPH|nr:CopD family protein [Hoeflea ulvae]MCY0096989.1 CopD family protein [Hoeflea ulvae]